VKAARAWTSAESPATVGIVETTEDRVAVRRSRLGRSIAHWLGTALLVLGVAVLAWTFVVWRWNDPFTSLYTHWQQGKLAAEHRRIVAEFQPTTRPPADRPTKAEEADIVRGEATRLRASAGTGAPIGRIIVPELGLNMLFVNGTDHETLKKGPGRYRGSYMPGEGRLIYIAGHRTTYGAPLAHIDRLEAGDRITLEMPYGTFVYAVTGHVIVDASDLGVLRSPRHEVLALQACHPRFFATQRYIVWAKPLLVKPRGGTPYRANRT
jgi:sortase A